MHVHEAHQSAWSPHRGKACGSLTIGQRPPVGGATGYVAGMAN
jgi:hypothetical protein